MKYNLNELLTEIKRQKITHYIYSVELCKDEVHLHCECECPRYPCSDREYYGQCCTPTESICECMIKILDNGYFCKFYLHTELAQEKHYAKSPCIPIEPFLQLLEGAKDKFDAMTDKGTMKFYDKDTMSDRVIFTIKAGDIL